MQYTQEQIAQVKAELKNVNGGKMTKQLVKDAHQTICNAYRHNWGTKTHSVNPNASEFKMQKANDIIDYVLAHGASKLASGAGRSIVRRRQ